MTGNNLTEMDFVRTAGNSSTTKVYPINTPSYITSGSHTISVDLASVGLVSGTTYSVQINGKDAANNAGSSNTIAGLAFDNVGPTTPTLTTQANTSSTTPTLAWSASTDDSGSGSGVKQYTLRLYSGGSCGGSALQTFTPTSTSQTVSTLTNGTYSWNVYTTDNALNVGSTSSCSSFTVDTSSPTISSQLITDMTSSSTTYTKSTRTIHITANVTNTDTSHIWLDLAPLSGASGLSAVSCASPAYGVTCSLASGVVTASFVVGFSGSVSDGSRSASIHIQNPAGINDQTASTSITVVNTPPSVSASTITSPNGGEIWGGTSRTITWNTSGITDALGISYLEVDYSTGGGTWNMIGTGANTGSMPWTITGLASRSDYSVRIIAYDALGNTASDTSDANFTIDLSPPTVASNVITAPSSTSIYTGGQTTNITWTTGSITDGGGLAATPIKLEYSVDNGSSWTTIASSLSNTGSTPWTVPSSTNVSTAKIRITASDIAGNTSTATTSAFIIDSTHPTVSVSYAGNGGTTPQNGRYINNSGFDISASASDAYLYQVQYSFQNTSNGQYWNGSSWGGSQTWNTLCTDATTLGTSTNCSTVAQTVTPTGITQGSGYQLIVRALDEAGNATSASPANYTGDTTAPTLSISTPDNSYAGTSLTITGSASDANAGLSSVSIEIRKGATWWDGTTWVGSQQLLSVTGTSSWSYVFMAPSGDADGQAYTVNVYAYDATLKTSNSSVQTIHLTKDTSGPTVGGSVFTFDTSPYRKGGDTLTVTWDTTQVTTVGAPLAGSPINLSYNFTGTVVSIATGLPNNGSYTFTIPAGVDTTTAKIIMTAYDIVGNSSTSVPSSNFIIDSTPPTIASVATMDMAAGGHIDAVQVTMSKSITDSTITLADFSLSAGIGTPTGWQTGSTPNDNTFILTFTATGTTGTTPTLTYTSGHLRDFAGNSLATTTITAVDTAVPRISSVTIYDNDSNGKTDQIRVVFTETLASATNTGAWTLNNLTAGKSITSVSTSGNTATLVIAEGTNYDTSTGGMTVTFTANSNWKDTSNNVAASSVGGLTLADAAVPVMVSSRTVDATSNNKIDRIDAVFSETLTGTLSGFSIASLATGSTYTGAITQSGTTLSFTIGETTSAYDTAQTPTIAYTGTGIHDTTGNVLATWTATGVTDGVAPALLSRETLDTDGNGKIDTIRLTFSENLNDNTSGLTVAVAGYTVTGYSSTCGSSTANDTIICALLTEGATPDTNATPTIQITSNGTLADSAGNLVVTEGSATAATDRAGPVVISARYDEGSAGVSDDILSLTFSESLSGATIDTTAGGSANDFVLSGGGAFGVASTTVLSGNTATITMGAGATALTIGTTKVGIKTGAAADTLSNISPTSNSSKNMVTVNANVVVNEVSFSTTAARQYIELRNLSSSATSLSGWTLSNVGTTITIPSGTTIAANGFYLIAYNNTAFSGVTADITTTSLSLNATTQSNILLKDSAGVTYDSVLSSPWPAGSGGLSVSMERKSSPGDGLTAANWYAAEVNTNLANASSLGTPKAANFFDSTPPVLASTLPANNSLLPSGSIPLTYQYSDNLSVNSGSVSLQLQRWNGSSWVDTTATGIVASPTVTATSAKYRTNALSSGRYQATITIPDTMGNSTTSSSIFSVDGLTVTVSTGSLALGTLVVGSQSTTSDVTVTVQTLGSAFTLVLSGSGTMDAGIASIGSYNGTT